MAWYSSLRRVTIQQGDRPTRITLVYPYYDCEMFFGRQVGIWQGYAADVKPHLSVIVVDDGSPRPVPHTTPHGVETRLFRIDVDVRWNWLAARNVGAHHAADGWLLLTDMDHVVPEATLRTLIWADLDPSVVYMFRRVEHTGQKIRPHSASYLMTRKMFWRIGGYDEALSGFYGTDGEFRRRVMHQATVQLIENAPLIRFEYVDDASVRTYKRKQPEDAMVQHLIAARGADWRPKTLSFPYHEVTTCSA